MKSLDFSNSALHCRIKKDKKKGIIKISWFSLFSLPLSLFKLQGGTWNLSPSEPSIYGVADLRLRSCVDVIFPISQKKKKGEVYVHGNPSLGYSNSLLWKSRCLIQHPWILFFPMGPFNPTLLSKEYRCSHTHWFVMAIHVQFWYHMLLSLQNIITYQSIRFISANI